MIKGGIIAIKSSRNQAFTGIISFSAGSLNNVHEPRNAEFTAFLGSFLVEWQSNDNNIWNYYIDKYHMNLSDKAVIDLLIFFNAESSSLISGSIVNKLPIKSISME